MLRAEEVSLAVLNGASLTLKADPASVSIRSEAVNPLSSTLRSAILAIDTASPSPAVSVWTPGGMAFDEPLPAERQASERLLSAIEECLRRAGVRLADCGRIAACSGPGSFTGVRVGLATAWGLSRAAGIPFETASTLEVLAESVRSRVDGRVAAAMDAGRGEIVWQPFDLVGTRARPTAEAERATPSDAISAGGGLPFVCVPETLLAGAAPSMPPGEPLARVLARSVARSPSDTVTPHLSAFYARPSAAEEKGKAAHGRP